MAQLLVRNLEDVVVKRLREEAAREQISVEEAHRRVLRRALLPEEEANKKTLWDHILEMPEVEGDEFIFDRAKDMPRPPPDLED